MNILFANYGDFATNSTSHIAGFANALADAGHSCVVAVPWGVDTVRLVPEVRFRAASFHECLEKPALFPNGQPADVLHAWTPREIIREFALGYCALSRARLIVHLEDNEDYLFSAATGLPITDLLNLDEDVIRSRITAALSHPRRARLLLRAAEGITTIVPTLRAFAPEGVPVLDLPPGVDFSLFQPVARSEARRTELGIRDGEKCIVYTGSTSFANAGETRDLYAAVALLNERGIPTRLVRTGADDPAFAGSIPESTRPFITHLGFIPRTELPQLLAQADVLVQPGRPGAFNNFRLPSKVPEFLAAGRPVIVPASNIGLELAHDSEAVVLGQATPDQIADACARVFSDAAFAARLGENAVVFARARFDGARQSRRLADFYKTICASPARHYSAGSIHTGESEIGLAMAHLVHHLPSPPGHAISMDLVDLLLPLVRNLDRPDGNRADLVRVEREREEWRKHFEDAREYAAHLDDQLSRTKKHTANLEQRITSREAELVALQHRQSVDVEALRQTIAHRDEKIARMTASFSWRATLPYRALRRLLFPSIIATPHRGGDPTKQPSDGQHDGRGAPGEAPTG